MRHTHDHLPTSHFDPFNLLSNPWIVLQIFFIIWALLILGATDAF